MFDEAVDANGDKYAEVGCSNCGYAQWELWVQEAVAPFPDCLVVRCGVCGEGHRAAMVDGPQLRSQPKGADN